MPYAYRNMSTMLRMSEQFLCYDFSIVCILKLDEVRLINEILNRCAIFLVGVYFCFSFKFLSCDNNSVQYVPLMLLRVRLVYVYVCFYLIMKTSIILQQTKNDKSLKKSKNYHLFEVDLIFQGCQLCFNCCQVFKRRKQIKHNSPAPSIFTE